jgi:hypothetical protein
MLSDVREAIAELVQKRFPSIQVSPYILASPTLPHAYLFPSNIDYDIAPGGLTMNARGGDTWTITLRALIGEVSDIGSQQLLDQLLEPNGATSMKAAVESDYTLGGLVYNVTAKTCSGYRQYQPTPTSAPVIGAEWTLEVFASG